LDALENICWESNPDCPLTALSVAVRCELSVINAVLMNVAPPSFSKFVSLGVDLVTRQHEVIQQQGKANVSYIGEPDVAVERPALPRCIRFRCQPADWLT
jgi:hypothetical protein